MNGPGRGLPCKFPFKYYGKVHNSCTDMMKKYTNNKPWCSTKVDETGKHMRGNWGNCDESCLSSPNGKESVWSAFLFSFSSGYKNNFVFIQFEANLLFLM